MRSIKITWRSQLGTDGGAVHHWKVRDTNIVKAAAEACRIVNGRLKPEEAAPWRSWLVIDGGTYTHWQEMEANMVKAAAEKNAGY